jgi:hypothetical protein
MFLKLMPKKAIIGLLLSSTLPIQPVLADRIWDEGNSPSNFDPNYIRDFNALPLSGEMDQSGHRGWADSYWPRVRGGIADRWQIPGYQYRDDRGPGIYDFFHTMTPIQIDRLSPAEKFDIIRGRWDFPITTRLRKKYKENEKDWRGLCNGWTHASLNIPEPQPIVYQDRRSGLKIPLGSSDIKGLLAYYYAEVDNSRARYIGRSCRSMSRILLNLNGACSDVHPGAFHIMMANELGIHKQGFAADRDPSVQVWNQPFVKFESRIDSIKTKDFGWSATKETQKELTITSVLTYANELYDNDEPTMETADHVAPSYFPVLATQKYRTIEYQYKLELDHRNRIIGGEWISDMRPDLIWRQNFTLPSRVLDEDGKIDDWSKLAEIIKLSTNGLPIGPLKTRH